MDLTEMNTILIDAAHKGDRQKVEEILLNNPPPPPQITEWCMLMAIRKGDFQLVQLLYDHRHEEFGTPSNLVSHAVRRGRLDIVKWLYSVGIRGDNGAVSSGISAGRIDILRWLYAEDPALFLFFRELEDAAMAGNFEIVKFIYAVWVETFQPEKLARDNGHHEIAEWLARKF
jgi:hypothetical protein